MERKKRIAPTLLLNSERDNSYRASVELAEKAGASRGRTYHDGDRGYGNRVGYNSHHFYQAQGFRGRGGGGYRQDTYRGRVVVEVVEGTETGFEDGMVRGE